MPRALVPALQLMRLAAAAPGGAGPPRAPPTLLVALEKRIAFTLHDLDVRAPAYDFWRTLFAGAGAAASPCAMLAGRSTGSGAGQALPPDAGAPGSSCASRGEPPSAAGQERAAEGGWGSRAALPLVGRRLDVGAVPQAIAEYERSEYLELWALQLRG